MKLKTLFLGLTLVLLPGLGASADGGNPVPDQDYQQTIEAYHQGRVERLTRPDGYLSLVGLHWLTPNAQLLPGIGVVKLVGEQVVLDLAPGTTVAGKPMESSTVGPDSPEGEPLFEHQGTNFYVIRRGPRIGLRVKDPESTYRVNFHGIERFPVDRQWRLLGRLEAAPATIGVASVVDAVTQESSPGWAVFDFEGQTYKVRLIGAVEDEDYFLVFSDATAGDSTYSACRFLSVEKGQDGALVLDFNKAVNPACSFTPFATCPLPPEGNVLPFAIPAGEKYSDK